MTKSSKPLACGHYYSSHHTLKLLVSMSLPQKLLCGWEFPALDNVYDVTNAHIAFSLACFNPNVSASGEFYLILETFTPVTYIPYLGLTV